MKIQELIFRVIRVYTPKLEQIIDIFLKRKNIFKPVKLKFSEIFFQNAWDCEESLSGSGSSLVQTVSIRKELPILLKKINNIKRVIDLGKSISYDYGLKSNIFFRCQVWHKDL